jgi:uncharacterized protein (DUF58 family)
MRPTTRGVGTALAGGALIAAGFAFGYPELAVLGVAALGAVLCAIGYALVRPGLRVQRTVDPDRVTRDEACTQILTVENTSRWRAATLVAQDRCGDRTVPVPLLRLRRGQTTVVSYPVPTVRRGVVWIGPLTVARRDPLGLVSASRTHGGTAQVWVYPRSHPLTAVPVGIARSLDGRVDRVPHGSITFDTLREYVIGDELRHVHWRTTARVGVLMVREHLDTSLPRIIVVLDDRAAAYPRTAPEAFEDACEAAASVVLAAVREELPVELIRVTGAESPTGIPGRRADFRPLLDRLAEAELTGRYSPTPKTGSAPAKPSRDKAPERVLQGVVKRLRQYRLGDTLVYLTGSGRTGDLPSIGALRSGYPTIVAGVFGDPDEVPSTVEGLFVLAVADAHAFALAWDSVGQW